MKTMVRIDKDVLKELKLLKIKTDAKNISDVIKELLNG